MTTKTIKQIDLQGFKIEETFIKNEDGSWTKTHLEVNGHDYCPFCRGFINEEDYTCKECNQDNENIRTLSNEELEEYLKEINLVNFF